MSRISRKKATVEAMIRVYCRGIHLSRGDLCEQCGGLLSYGLNRLDRCRFGNGKPTCKKCPVHCYSPEQRSRIREVMRYSGPRMMLHHPLLTIMHLIDGRTGGRQVQNGDQG